MRKNFIRVVYWRGTTQRESFATTYKGAMRIAALNQNAYSPRFYDHEGKELHDTGYGLAYAEPDANGNIVCAVIGESL